jgi:phage terminase large subunit GpA-like protein
MLNSTPSEFPPKVAAARVRCYAQWLPPPPLKLVEWADDNIVLPAAQSVRPGAYRTWPYLREPLEAIGARSPEYVTIQKSSRIGFTKALIIAIAGMVANDPCSIGLLVPVDEDARDYVVDELEPLFAATPALRGLIVSGRLTGRNTLTRKTFKTSATLKILSARAPRRLRRHDFKVLYCDEIDAMEITSEGDPLLIAEKRTFAHADRKIVRGSTPTEEDVSLIERAYAESDQRIYELQCPHCADWFELLWHMIQWPEGEPEKATAFCPHCGCEIDERRKPGLVERGRWRPQRPAIVNHRGFRLSALVSLLPNAAWPKLAEEFLKAKRGGPAELQVFTNLTLGKTWKTSLNRLSAETLAGRVEPIGLERIPEEIVLLTCGADVQDDRVEACVVGWPVAGAPCVLAHVIIDGNTLEDQTWRDFDAFLMARWRHPFGWEIKIDGTAIDSGGHEGRTQKVYDFAGVRLHRRIYAIRGVGGARPIWARAQRIKSGKTARLFIIGHDQVKTAVLEVLGQEPFDAEGKPNPHALRVSDELPPEWSNKRPARSGGSGMCATAPSSSLCPSGAGKGSRRSTRCATLGRCGKARRSRRSTCAPAWRAVRNQPSASRRRAVLQSQCGQAGSMNNHSRHPGASLAQRPHAAVRGRLPQAEASTGRLSLRLLEAVLRQGQIDELACAAVEPFGGDSKVVLRPPERVG